jgi:phosphohistidine phosphatase
MLLLLNRHAAAAARDSSQWPDDSERPLTDKGRKVQSDVSRWLRKRNLVPTLVLTSPWSRAAETAAILVNVARVAQPPVPCEPLAEDPDLIRLQDHVGEQPADAIVAMVGHSPWMEELASILLGGSAASLRIDFPKSGVMGIELERLEPGAGELRFLVRPKMV